MTDRLSLANGRADAKIERSAAEGVATEILDAIRDNVATRVDLQRVEESLRGESPGVEHRMPLRVAELEQQLSVRFASVMVVLLGLPFAALRYLPPAH